jgi:hypothetical protein
MKLLCAVAAAALMAAPAAQAGPSGYRVVDQIAGPDGGWDFLHVAPASNRLFVTRGTSLMAVDLATGKVTAGLAPGKRLHDPLPLHGGRELLVTHGGSDTAVFVDAATGATLGSVATGANPDAAVLEPRSGLVAVMDHTGGDVTLVDPKARAAVGRAPVGGALEVAVADGQGHIYVNVEDRQETAEVDIAARTVTRRFKLRDCEGPTGLAYYAARRWLVAACDGASNVLDAGSGAVVAVLKTGPEADGAAVDEGRGLAFVPGRDGTLSVISLKGPKPELVDVVRTAPGVRTLALDPRDGRIYLPAADMGPAVSGAKPEPVPGSFKLIVVAPPGA